MSSLAFLVCSAQAAVGRYFDRRDSRSRREPWTEAELEILRRHYVPRGSQYCKRELPRRTIHSIRHKATEIGLYRDRKERWGRDELDIVIKGVAAGENTTEIQQHLEAQGFVRTHVAVRDCRLSVIRRFDA